MVCHLLTSPNSFAANVPLFYLFPLKWPPIALTYVRLILTLRGLQCCFSCLECSSPRRLHGSSPCPGVSSLRGLPQQAFQNIFSCFIFHPSADCYLKLYSTQFILFYLLIFCSSNYNANLTRAIFGCCISRA